MTNKQIERRFEAIRLVASVAIAVVLCFIIILFISDNPLKALRYLVVGPFTSLNRFGQIIEKVQPLLLTGCAMNLMILAGNFSMIPEGCFLLAPCLTVPVVIINEKIFGGLANLGEFGRIIWVTCSIICGGIIGAIIGDAPAAQMQFGLQQVAFVTRPADKYQIGKTLHELRGYPGEEIFGLIRKSGNFLLHTIDDARPEPGDSIVYAKTVD